MIAPIVETTNMEELPTYVLFELTRYDYNGYLNYLATSLEVLKELDRRGIEWLESQENWLPE